MENDVYKIIALYRQYPCLWDFKSPLYKRMDLKRSAWEEIAVEMCKSVEEVKKKVKYLRSAYVAEKKKVDEAKNSGSDDIYTPILYYYNELNFLDCVITPRQKCISLPNESTEMIDVCPEYFEPECKLENNTECSQDSSYSTSNNKMLSSTPNTGKNWKSLKRARVDRDIKFCEAFDAVLAKVQKATEEEDTMFSAFGRSIAMQLSKMPIIDATYAMADIQKLVAMKMQNCFIQDDYNYVGP